MSYILEALKKADQEHFLGAVPDLATPHEARHPQSRSNRWIWIIVALLSVNAVLVVMLLKYRDAQDAAIPVAARAHVPLEAQTALTNDQLVQPVQQTSEVHVSEARVSQAPVPEKSVLQKNEPILTSGGVVVLPEPAMQMDTMTTANDNSQLQGWYELPQELRNKLELPRLDVHVYSEDPQGRFILVNLKKYREGERLASGLVLEEILPDGMVMSYQGERFLVEK